MDAVQMAKDWLKTNDPYEPEDGYQARKIIEALINPWQPIETAPKDGSWVLVYCTDDEPIDESYENRPVSAQWTNELNGRIVDFHWQFAWFDGGYFGDVNPTHWMPLPEPPQSLSASDDIDNYDGGA